MAGRLPSPCTPLGRVRRGPLRGLALCPWMLIASLAAHAQSPPPARAQFTAANVGGLQQSEPGSEDDEGVEAVRPRYGPPGETPGIPSDAVLEKQQAIIGEVLIDNQNIFNLDDPAEDHKIFRLADKLHFKTRAT